MKFRNISLIVLMFCSQLLFAQNSSLKAFFSYNPADIGLVGHMYNYSITPINSLPRGGKNYTGFAQVGQRITLKKNRNSSMYLRQGFEFGLAGKGSYSFVAPLTFNIGLGAGSHVKCNSKWGFVATAGYAYHKMNFTKEYDNLLYPITNVFYSPHIQIGVTNFTNINKLVQGLYLSAGRNHKYYSFSLMYVINLMY